MYFHIPRTLCSFLFCELKCAKATAWLHDFEEFLHKSAVCFKTGKKLRASQVVLCGIRRMSSQSALRDS